MHQYGLYFLHFLSFFGVLGLLDSFPFGKEVSLCFSDEEVAISGTDVAVPSSSGDNVVCCCSDDVFLCQCNEYLVASCDGVVPSLFTPEGVPLSSGEVALPSFNGEEVACVSSFPVKVKLLFFDEVFFPTLSVVDNGVSS